MSILISANSLTKAFAARPLFSNLNFVIESGARIGLIGPNGAGKSTLLRILSGKDTPDTGRLSLQRGLRVGHLEQVPTFKSGLEIQTAVLEGAPDPDDWEAIAQASEIMAKLDLRGEDRVDSLSGGWKKRVALARELVKKPDLLLLDEPTNHLDVESILWLEEFLAKSQFATLTITHDRVFLQKVSNQIWELDKRNAGGLLVVTGSYADYLDIKDQQLSAQENREVRLKNTLRRETEWLRQGAKARTTKQQARIQRQGELAQEVSELEYRNQSRTARIDFQSSERTPKKLLEAKGVSKSYGARKLFEPLDVILGPGTRVGLLGRNGCGKSTLIRILLGQEKSDSGEVKHSDNLQVAYFEQNRESLDPKVTVAKTLCPVGDHVDYRGTRVHIRGYLDRFLFSQGQMDMAVGKLSGGEQSRLLLARLMLQPANLLVLDEPTNDLDMETLNVLQDCLTEFSGAVLLVTHDRYFLDQVATQILAFPPDISSSRKLTFFSGLGQWEVWHDEMEASAIKKSKEAVAASSQKKKKLSYKDQRDWDTIEARIHSVEAKIAELNDQSADPQIASNSIRLGEIAAELATAQKELDQLYARWEELSGMM